MNVYIERYEKALHAMQTGVAFVMGHAVAETEPKHLRVGINSAMIEHGALVRLLIKKGVITENEYLEAIAEAMEAEAKRYSDKIFELTGIRPNLV